MRRLPTLIVTALAFAALGVPLASRTAAAQTAATQNPARCEPDTLSKTLHERMKQDGKTDAEIGDILGSSFKRKILVGRVSDGSGCTAEQTDKALDVLATSIKHG